MMMVMNSEKNRNGGWQWKGYERTENQGRIRKKGKRKEEQKWKTGEVEPNGGKLHTGDKCGNGSYIYNIYTQLFFDSWSNVQIKEKNVSSKLIYIYVS